LREGNPIVGDVVGMVAGQGRGIVERGKALCGLIQKDGVLEVSFGHGARFVVWLRLEGRWVEAHAGLGGVGFLAEAGGRVTVMLGVGEKTCQGRDSGEEGGLEVGKERTSQVGAWRPG